jgi:hypothetical protein
MRATAGLPSSGSGCARNASAPSEPAAGAEGGAARAGAAAVFTGTTPNIKMQVTEWETDEQGNLSRKVYSE